MSIPVNGDWLSNVDEGQLSVDVFRDGDMLVVRSLVAGVKPDDLDVSIHGDLLTIRGRRSDVSEENSQDWFYRECYWGSFSRSVVLPFHVATDAAQAQLQNGVLEVRVPIRKDGNSVKVKWA